MGAKSIDPLLDVSGEYPPDTMIINPYRFAVSGGGGYLIEENFEGPGYDNSNVNGWVESGATITPNYNTTPAPLVGSYSLRLNASAAQPRAYVPFTAQSDVFAFFACHVISGSDSSRIIASINDSSGTLLLSIEWRSSDNSWIIRSPGGSTNLTDTAFAPGTTYYIWLRYTKGTGANAFASIGIATTQTEPTSGGGYKTITNGTSTADAARLYFGQVGGNGVLNYVFDKVRIKNSSIGSNPV